MTPRRERAAPSAPPILVVAAASGLLAFFIFPLIGLLARVPWRTLPAEVASAEVRAAFGLSIVTSTCATLLSVALGVPLAWLLARGRIPGLSFIRALVALPMVLPPVAGGVALLAAYGRRGLLGPALGEIGVRLPFTTAGVVAAETFVAMPFLVLAVEGALRSLDRRYEEAAATLGSRPLATLVRVTLPMALPAVASGAAMTWARALGEFGATITFAGNLGGRTQTLPLAVYVALESRPDGALALSLILLVVSMAVLALLGPRALGRTAGVR